MEKFKGKPYRIISRLLLISLFLNFTLFSSVPSVYAQSPKLKNAPGIKLYKSGGGILFDHEKEEPETVITTAKYAGAQEDGRLKLWTFASAWGGKAKSALRGIDYVDFYLDGDVPKGTRVKSSLLVPIECHGYVNRADFSGGDTRYYLKLETGFLTERNMKSWDAPGLGKTLFSKTDDTNPPGEWQKDLAEKVIKEIASQLIEEGVKAGAKALGAAVSAIPIIGAVVQAVIFIVETSIKLDEFNKDTERIEFSFSSDSSVEYKDIWLEVGSKYRVYLSLDSETEARGTLDNMSFVYVDFYNHPPHFGDNDGKWMQRRGFRIKDVYLKDYDSTNIQISEDHWYPIIEVSDFRAATEEALITGKEFPMLITFINKGKRISEPCKVQINTPDPKKYFTIDLERIPPGKTYNYSFKYTFTQAGQNTFTTVIDEDGALDLYLDLSRTQSFKFDLRSLPDLKIDSIKADNEVIVNKKNKIDVRVKNIGMNAAPASKIKLLIDGRVEEEKQVRALKVGEYEDIKFYWAPKKATLYNLKFIVDSDKKIEESDEGNNAIEQRWDVWLPHYRWLIEEASLKIDPSSAKTGEEAQIYFTIKNEGRSEESIPYEVRVDDKVIKQSVVFLSKNSSQTVGKTYHDKITWKATGGRHAIKVILDPQNTFPDLERVGTTQELVLSPPVPMPAVSGVDFVIDAKDVNIKHNKINFKIYNRGTRPGTTDIFLHKYGSREENPAGFSTFRRTFAAQSYEDFSVLLPPDIYNSKIEIIIDLNNMVKEVSEDNNSTSYIYGRYRPYEPPPPPERTGGPDLAVAQVVNLDRPIEPGETREIAVYIGNINMVDANGVDVEYEFWNFDRNDIQPSHCYLKGTKSLGTIKAESKESFNIDYKGVYPGRYKLTIIVDPQNKVQETDEYSNNRLEKFFKVGGEVTSEMFFSGKGVDLSIDENIKVSNPKPAAGMPVNFEVSVHNNSAINVWGADLDMFVNDKLESGQYLGDFVSSSSNTLSFQYTFDASGDYTVKFMVDAKEKVPETDESNNTATTNIEVLTGIFGTGHRDVAVTSLNLSKASCFQGEPVTANATIKNVGQDTLNAVLCTIGPFESAPVYFKVLPVLEPEEEVEIFTTLPALIAGDHIIEARIDGRNIISEENEENNVLSTSLHVEPITTEGIKAKGAGVVLEKINNARDAFNRWLRGLGKPKQ